MAKLHDYIEDPRFVKWALDPDEETEAYFKDYIERHPDERAGLLRARAELRVLQVRQPAISKSRKSEIFDTVITCGLRVTARERKISVRVVMSYAAVAILFFALGFAITNVLQESRSFSVPESLLVKSAALNTMIYLSDGSKKEISDSKMLIDFSNVGKLVLGADTFDLLSKGLAEAANIVVVPYGKRAEVCLYDKSTVQLNAGSRIIIPEHFSSEDRSASLFGEAFFDIRKDPAHPFIVSTTKTEIKVLGTSFSVDAYPDMKEQTIFLKEGKVSIRDINHSLLAGWEKLSPNEQAKLDVETGKIVISKGNEQSYDLWKRGIISINNESVDAVVAEVERFFNISINVTNEQIRTRLLNGKMHLNTNMNEVFEYLENLTDGTIEKVSAGEYVLR